MKLHLVGICGTGMGALAGLLKAAGHDVRGSDDHVYPPMSDQLRALGVPLFEGFRAENLDWGPDQVVVGNVCTKDHVEVVAAGARGLPLTSFPAVLETELLPGRHSVVVAGTHGKTTTTALLAFLLVDAGRDPSFLIGGVPQNFGKGYRLGGGPHFVVEGDEYDSAFFDKGSKFFHYQPRTAILTSIELDHVDIFASFAAVEAAFARFVELIPGPGPGPGGHAGPAGGLLLVAATSAAALAVAAKAQCRVETYAVRRPAPGVTSTWTAELLPATTPTRTTFLVRRGGEVFARFDVGLTGEHNIENALAAVAAATELGLTPEEIDRGLRRFGGVKRRQELRGIAAGVSVIDDYAHHPTAVKETLAALRRRVGRGKLVAVYEPRSATSRRATFQTEFADAFAGADEVVVAKLYNPDAIPAADRFDPEKLAADLRSRGTAARMIPDVPAIVAHVAERVQPGDLVVVFTTGEFDKIFDRLLAQLGDPIRPARPEDMARVRAILDVVGLRQKDMSDERAPDVLVVLDGETVVGCVTVEVYDEAAVLRLLGVIPDKRGHGFGWMLADHAVARAKEKGARRLYLLTETASDFFAEKFGFRAIDRATIDATVAQSPTFRETARSAVAMRLDL
jgi:UDP-N-acetylmuramate: L-alanyl-gamma-D-glutamyl-meso-diaminopimelate ligase